MDFDNRKVYGDTSITDGLVILSMKAEEACFTFLLHSHLFSTPCNGASVQRTFFDKCIPATHFTGGEI